MGVDPVADDTDTETAETGAPTNAELDQRINSLDSKIDTILDKLGGARDSAHEHAAEHTAERLDRPTSIADEIRQQLAAQRAKDETDAAGKADQEWKQGVNDTLAGLQEKIPEPPQRRIEKVMGWR